MSVSYQPGDIEYEITLLDKPVTTGFISCSIYESIFMPCIVAEFNFRDNDDALFAGLNLSGGESLNISFLAPGGETAEYKFLINKPGNMEPGQQYKSRTMNLICTSEEAFRAAGGHNSNGYVLKSYKGKLISDNVSDILKSYLKTTKKIKIEDTKGPQEIIASNEKVWPLIDRMRRRAVSSSEKSSSYVFFENQNGFNFVTIESLFGGEVVKKFVQDSTIGSDMMKLTDNNIFGYELPHVFSAMDRIDRGTMNSRYTTFNYQTNEYRKKTVKNPEKGDDYGGDGEWNNSSFVKKFGKYPGRNSNIPYDNRLPMTNIPEYTPNQLAYSGMLMQNMIRLRVFGDAKLKAGDMIEASIQQQKSYSGGEGEDTDISGQMLVASIRHMINPEGERPKYSCVLECLKGRPEK